MTAFSTDWLALREPFDRAARGEADTLDLRALALRLRGGDGELGVIDLACGTGANLRALAPRLGGSQRWLLVDHDPALLAALPDVLGVWAHARGFVLHADGECLRIEGPDWDAALEPLCIDLASALASVPLAQARLVTASALLDLVSEAWLDDLLAHAQAVGAAMLFALDVDGRIEWAPGDGSDAAVRRLFAAHQRGDKGFGTAIGGDAADVVAQRLAAMGWRIAQSASDWRIDAREGPLAVTMLTTMVEGMAAAALEQDPTAHALVGAWKARRLTLVERTLLRVGHRDVLATLFPLPLGGG